MNERTSSIKLKIEVISTMNERTSSIKFKIAKLIYAKCKNVLPMNYEKLFLVHLCRLYKIGKLTKFKVS